MYQLNDGRILRPDGISIVNQESLVNFILAGISPKQLAVTEITPEVQQFNRRTPDKIIQAGELEDNFDISFSIPPEYAQIDLCKYFSDLMESNQAWLTDPYINRAEAELEFIICNSVEDYFKTIIYVIDSLKAGNIIFGIGRGSSCASFLLFMIGLHTVDPILYDIPMDEFFHL